MYLADEKSRGLFRRVDVVGGGGNSQAGGCGRCAKLDHLKGVKLQSIWLVEFSLGVDEFYKLFEVFVPLICVSQFSHLV